MDVQSSVKVGASITVIIGLLATTFGAFFWKLWEVDSTQSEVEQANRDQDEEIKEVSGRCHDTGILVATLRTDLSSLRTELEIRQEVFEKLADDRFTGKEGISLRREIEENHKTLRRDIFRLENAFLKMQEYLLHYRVGGPEIGYEMILNGT